MAHLSKSVVDSWYEQQESLSILTHDVIYERLNEVVMIIGRSFGRDMEDMWCLSTANHYALCEAAYEKFISIEIDGMKQNSCAILADGKWDFSAGSEVYIPSRWLYEDFEQELKDGILKFQSAFDAEQPERLRAAIERKLTKEELELISFK